MYFRESFKRIFFYFYCALVICMSSHTYSNSAPVLDVTSGFSTSPITLIDNTYGISREPLIVDLNNDNRFDLVFISYNSAYKLVIYLQELDMTFSHYANIPTPNDNTFLFELSSIDLDNDGDLDIISAGANSDNYIFENTGSDSSPSFLEGVSVHDLNVNGFYGQGVEVKDIDGDGKLDVIWQGTGGVIIGYGDWNNVSGFSQVDEISYLNPGSSSDLIVQDADGDGDLDVFVSHYTSVTVTGGFSILINNGGRNYSQVVFDTSNSGVLFDMVNNRLSPYRFSVSDLDSDGRNDLVFTNVAQHHSATEQALIVGLRTSVDGSVPSYSFISVDGSPDNYSGFDSEDINNDGYADVLISKSNSTKIYLGDGVGSFQLDDTVSIGNSFTFFSDLNRDGRSDLLMSSAGAKVIYQDYSYSIQVNENQTAVTDINASDIDGDAISYSISGIDSVHFSINSSSGIITFISPADFEGPLDFDGDNQYEISVTATDDGTGSLSTQKPVFINVININETPLISGAAGLVVNEDNLYSFLPTITDEDIGDTHIFSITNKPTWASFDNNSGALTGIPSNADVGVQSNISINVTDVVGATDSLASFSITVNNTNDAPLISGSPATSVNVEANYSFIPSATDIDLGDTYSYSISNQPQWATFDSITGTLSGIPTNSDAGMHPNIVITVTDAAGATASLASFAITVNTTNDVPTINASAQVLFINDKEEIMPFANVLLFDDSDTISLSLNFDAGNGILNGNGFSGSFGAYSIASQSVDSVQTILQSLRFIPRQNQVSAGNFVNTLFYITATDGVLTSAVNSSIQVSTESVNDAPIVYGQSIRVVEGSIADIAFYAEDLENDEITFSQMSSPAHGELAISGDIGTYISDQGYTGGDRFSIVANDGFDDSLPFVVDLKVLAEGDETMAVNDTIYLPVNSVTHQYELDVLANDNQANDPKLVSVLCLFGEVRIENNMLILYLETIAQPFITLTYVIEDSRGIYAKAQVNLVVDG